ncbi:MAG: alpha/beta hydrolase [Saprospiraceae bacterium]|nr:alpha/beta hydrolase [Saprospiraceae bacterium]MDZ4706530.1 alpha/beta hydrolase [Saprospiraceae bacterium]
MIPNFNFQKKRLTLPDQTTVAYLDTGHDAAKPTLVMVHGLGNNASVWLRLMAQIQGQYRCIALDLPAHGDSQACTQACGINYFSATVEGLIEGLQLGQVMLMGHSMGGLVSIKTILRKPTVVKQCILLAPAGFETFTLKEKAWLKAIYAVWMLKKMSAARMEQQTRESFFRFPPDFEFAVQEIIAIRESPEAFEAYCETLSLCMNSLLNESVFDTLSTISLPCTVFFGIEDLTIPNKVLHPNLTAIEVAEQGTRKIPNATLHLIPECGHTLQWEAADQIADFLLNLVSYSSSAGSGR